MLKQSLPLAPPASQFWWKQSLHLSHLLTVVFWRKLGFYSHWVGPPFPICSHLCLPFLSVLVSFLYFRSGDWYYGCITITPYLKCLEPGVFPILEFCIFWIISMHNAVLHLGVFVTFVTAVTRYTTGSNLARFIFFSYSSWGGKIHGDTNAWWRECKESHIALALRTQRGEHWYLQCTLLFICLFNLGTQALEWCYPYSGWVVPWQTCREMSFLEGAKFSWANSED